MDTEPRDFLRAYLAEEGMTLQDLAERMEQFKADCRFLSEYYPALQELCPNLWIAVYQEQVVGNDGDLESLLSFLDGKEYPLGDLAIRFVYPVGEEPVWKLYAAA